MLPKCDICKLAPELPLLISDKLEPKPIPSPCELPLLKSKRVTGVEVDIPILPPVKYESPLEFNNTFTVLPAFLNCSL